MTTAEDRAHVRDEWEADESTPSDFTKETPMPDLAPLDLDAIELEFLSECDPHEFGVPGSCNCATRDYRPTMDTLVTRVRDLEAELADARTEVEVQSAMVHNARLEVERLQPYAGPGPYAPARDGAKAPTWRELRALADHNSRLYSDASVERDALRATVQRVEALVPVGDCKDRKYGCHCYFVDPTELRAALAQPGGSDD